MIVHSQGAQAYLIVFSPGEEAVAGLAKFAGERSIGAASLTGLGGFAEAVLGYYDPLQRNYLELPVAEQVEVCALTGNLSLFEDAPKVHCHAVLGRSDGGTVGGHLLEGHVWPTLEVFLQVLPQPLHRATDPATGAASLQPPRESV